MREEEILDADLWLHTVVVTVRWCLQPETITSSAMSLPSPGSLPSLILIFSSVVTTALSYHITKAYSGTISGGEVVYYHVSSTNPVVMVLISEFGDADLYASPTKINPKPSSDNHETNSASCGLDMLSLIMSPSLQKYSLGVYGHVRYEESKFSLYCVEPSEEDIRSYQVGVCVQKAPSVVAGMPELFIIPSLYKNTLLWAKP